MEKLKESFLNLLFYHYLVLRLNLSHLVDQLVRQNYFDLNLRHHQLM
jgi:hypothetical protein